MSFTMAPLPSTTPVLVVGGGPAGLIAALQLSKQGVSCTLIERNLDTTQWPKMDLTNCRSMELFRPNRLDLGDGLRSVGVPGKYSMDVLFSTGLSDGGEVITKWDMPSHDDFRRMIRDKNDGSMPRDASQRCSQAVFEAWLKPRIQAEPLIHSFFGCKFEGLTEYEDRVECEVSDMQSGERYNVSAQYVIGCDGGGSRVRRSIGGEMVGGPVPAALYLVHFKSTDLKRLHRQGQFWHILFSSGHAIIAQDEEDTWTLHTPIPLDLDTSTLDPYEAVYNGLGASCDPFPIKIDKILVTSVWRPNIYIANKFTSGYERVFLSGDAAHQLVPFGGYGMNTAVGDSFDIGWKIAAVLGGYGGEHILTSYQEERMPVAHQNLERSGGHWEVQATYWGWVQESDGAVKAKDEKGVELRANIAALFAEKDGENRDIGIELGYRYTTSSIVCKEENPEEEPPKSPRSYIPSTWPGVRAPHVFLADGRTSTFDLFGRGREFTLVDFTADKQYGQRFRPSAETLGMPLKVVHLPDEHHVRKVWEREAVLIRPDDHVCWRARVDGNANILDVDSILLLVLGRKTSASKHSNDIALLESARRDGFSGTLGNVNRDKVEKLAEWEN